VPGGALSLNLFERNTSVCWQNQFCVFTNLARPTIL